MRLWGRESEKRAVGKAETDGEAVADVLSLSSQRIGEIVSAAERAADDIGAATRERLSGDAGSQITRERIVAELAESLARRVNDLSAEAAALADLLSRASERLGTPAPGRTLERRASAGRPEAPESRQPTNEGLRLLATQMAVAGSTYGEIEERLRSEFGVEDPSTVLGGRFLGGPPQ